MKRLSTGPWGRCVHQPHLWADGLRRVMPVSDQKVFSSLLLLPGWGVFLWGMDIGWGQYQSPKMVDTPQGTLCFLRRGEEEPEHGGRQQVLLPVSADAGFWIYQMAAQLPLLRLCPPLCILVCKTTSETQTFPPPSMAIDSGNHWFIVPSSHHYRMVWLSEAAAICLSKSP